MTFFDLLGKEVLSLKKNLGVVVILFLVPVFIILIMGFAFQDKEVTYGIGFVNNDHSSKVSSGFLKSLKKVSALDVDVYAHEKKAHEDLKNEKITGYIVVPKGFEKKQEKGLDSNIKLVVDNSKTVNASVVEGIVGKFVEKFNTRVVGVLSAVHTFNKLEPSQRTNKVVQVASSYVSNLKKDPIQINEKYVVATEKNNKMSSFNQTTCGMTAMFILFLCVLWGSTNILEEKLSGTLTRLVLSPTSLVTILSSKLAFTSILAFLQFAIFFTIGHILLKVPLGSPALLVLLNLLFIIQAASLGLLISIVAKSRISAIGLSFFVIMILSPLGGLWFPLEQVPKALQTFASFLPTGAFMVGIEKIIIKGDGLISILKSLIVILVYFLIAFTASLKIGVLKKVSQ